MNLNKLVVAAAAAVSMTGLAACGSGDTNTKSGRDAFMKGCTGAPHTGFSDKQLNQYCTCAVDELKKKGLNTGDELKKAQADKSAAYEGAIKTCALKYLVRGY